MLSCLSCAGRNFTNSSNLLQKTLIARDLNKSKKTFNDSNQQSSTKTFSCTIDTSKFPSNETFKNLKYYVPFYPYPRVIVDDDFFKVLEIKTTDTEHKKKLKLDLTNFFITKYGEELPDNVKNENEYIIGRSLITGAFIIPYVLSESMFFGIGVSFVYLLFCAKVIEDPTSSYNKKNLYDKIKNGEI